MSRQHLTFHSTYAEPNAAHHAPPGQIAGDDSLRVGGRVHALVRRRPSPAETRARRHTASAIPAPRSPAPSRPYRRLTPRITRPPTPSAVDDSARVAGRVHA